MFELLFLLLPIAVAYGWFMGKREKNQKNQDRSDQMTRSYVDGLNFLLSNKKEEAIDLFLKQFKSEENYNFETHLTIGNLFRSRGEVERAIHIHRSLLDSDLLTSEERLLTQKELAQDYLSIGFYDRAEEILLILSDEEDFNLFAYQQLISIYQSTLEWDKAIECAVRLIKLGDKTYHRQVGQFYCELAMLSMNETLYERAKMLAVKALSFDPNSVRASLILGKIALEHDQYAVAANHFMQTLKQNLVFVSEALPYLQNCFTHLNIKDLKPFLEECIAKNVGDKAELMLVKIIEQERNYDAARENLIRYLAKNPNLSVFSCLIDYYLIDAEAGNAKDSLVLLKKMVEMQIKQLPNYQCEQCGFAVKTLYWLCPKCKTWESIKPIQHFTSNLLKYQK